VIRGRSLDKFIKEITIFYLMALRQVPSTIDELPALKAGHVRVVVLTKSPDSLLESLTDKGKKYSGTPTSIGGPYKDPKQAKYYSTDLNFSGPGTAAIVLDIPNREYKPDDPPHLNQKYIVGILDSYKAQQEHGKKGKPSGLEKAVELLIIGLVFLSIAFFMPNVTGYAVASLDPGVSNRLGLIMALAAVGVSVLFLRREKK